MADTPLGIDIANLIGALDDWLAGSLGAVPLQPARLARWQHQDIRRGWRIGVEIAGQAILIDLLLDGGFPFSLPRLAWVDPPRFPSIPHVESDGKICALSSAATFDPSNPIDLVKHLLGDAERILEDGLSGANVDDFRAEFRSYWNEMATGRKVVSLTDPSGPSRRLHGWFGTEKNYVAEDRTALRQWLSNAGLKKNIADFNIHPVALLWLDQALIPAEYPVDLAGLVALCGRCEGDAAAILESVLAAEDRPLVMLGFPTSDGAATFAAIRLETNGGRRHRGHQPRLRGFRDHAPKRSLVEAHRTDRLIRSAVDRADSWWVHGRDSNPDVTTLAGSSVVLIGCGSLGSPLARFLAQAGVGKLVLIDPETMTRANAGRHLMGADAADFAKASAMKLRLNREFPHLNVDAFTKHWQIVAADQPNLLMRCDLVLSTIGGWEQEAPLNRFRSVHADYPPILYAWTEPHGSAGQAVLTGATSGCLACGLDDHGSALFRVTAFEASTLRREAACGAFFQPYGGADIATVAALASGLAIDALCDRAGPGTHRLVASPLSEIAQVGGSLTPAWIELSQGRSWGGNREERLWTPRTGCPACGGQGL